MEDRELLGRAARAAGLEGEWGKTIGGWDCLIVPGSPYGAWQPLHSDGDALRLAARLQIDVRHYASFVDCEHRGGSIWPAYDSEHGGDRGAATRRAIVRAAAELARDPS